MVKNVARAAKALQSADSHLLEHFRQRIGDDFDALYDALRDEAIGLWVKEQTPGGEERVYQRPPNVQAAMFLVNHQVGTPVKRAESTQTHVLTYEERLEQFRKSLSQPQTPLPAPKTVAEEPIEADFRQIPAENPSSEPENDPREAVRARLLTARRGADGA